MFVMISWESEDGNWRRKAHQSILLQTISECSSLFFLKREKIEQMNNTNPLQRPYSTLIQPRISSLLPSNPPSTPLPSSSPTLKKPKKTPKHPPNPQPHKTQQKRTSQPLNPPKKTYKHINRKTLHIHLTPSPHPPPSPPPPSTPYNSLYPIPAPQPHLP